MAAARAAVREQLEMQIGEILTRPAPTPRVALPSAFDPEPEAPPAPVARPDGREPFGRWLIAQQKRDGWIGDLARAAKADPRFPKDGDPEAARHWLATQRASGDDYEALDDAELDWLSL